MEIRYCIYALDTDENRVTAALSCPDEKTARRVLRIVLEKMKDLPSVLRLDYVTIDIAGFRRQSSFRSVGAFLCSLPPHGLALPGTSAFRGNLQREDLSIFDIDKLELIESKTEKCLASSKCFNRLDIQAMRHVKLAIGQDDVFDRLAKLKGRWVSQKDFLDKNINTKAFTLKTLHTYRSGQKVERSKKDSSIGVDKGGNFLKITRESDNKNDPNTTYQYFLLREFDRQFPS